MPAWLGDHAPTADPCDGRVSSCEEDSCPSLTLARQPRQYIPISFRSFSAAGNHMRRFFLSVALLFPAVLFAAEPPEGVLPVGADGKTLNLDFETGDLRDWTATGEAFKGQPIKGDTVAPRRSDSQSQHQGQYWIGGFEKLGDKPQGTLTSAPFKVTHPWAAFLVGGGPWPETCVEIILKDGNKLITRASGLEEENLRRVAGDLRAYQGKESFIRI